MYLDSNGDGIQTAADFVNKGVVIAVSSYERNQKLEKTLVLVKLIIADWLRSGWQLLRHFGARLFRRSAGGR
jgi:hypothetical protein